MYNIKSLLKLYFFNKKWREKNPHNFTRAGFLFPIDAVTVGKYSYGEINAKFFGNQAERLKIGNYVSIAEDVYFCMGGEHEMGHIMTYPFDEKLFHNKSSRTKGEIIVEDDVWIGTRATILSGVTIGKGAVIAAGSVICKDVPPYAVVASNRIIRYRFSAEICNKLCEIDYGKLNIDQLKKMKNILNMNVDKNNVEFIADKIQEK